MTDTQPIQPGILNDPDEPKLRYFSWAHLPYPLQEISRGFGELALWLCENVARSAERTLALNDLLAAKDWAVRAALPPAPAYPLIPKSPARIDGDQALPPSIELDIRRSDQGARLGAPPSYDQLGPAGRVVGGFDTLANPSRTQE